MAQQKVFVASDVGGHRELVRHGVTGILYKADDAPALVEAVMSLLGSHQLKQQLRAEGLNFVREERNWARIVSLYERVYGEAVAQVGHRRAA
jgi:glycosyltransferase involved in cell wall biosynthesis